MSRIRLTTTALDDLAEIWRYIALESQSPNVADALADVIDERFQLLASNPHLGEKVDHLRIDTRRSIVKNAS